MSIGSSVDASARERPGDTGATGAQLIDGDVAERIAATFAMLADPTRARLLHALSLTDELHVSDLAGLLGMSQSAVSHQLRSLRDNRVVARRRDGRVVYYRLADDHVRHILADALRHALEPHDPSAGGSGVAATGGG